MNVSFRKSFARDLKRIKDASVLRRVQQVIEETEAADQLQEIANLKKLTERDGGLLQDSRRRVQDRRRLRGRRR